MKEQNQELVTLQEYAESLIYCFGDNAKIGLCYLAATIFKDIVIETIGAFPLLHIFGRLATGKTELAKSLRACFVEEYEAPNYMTTPTRMLYAGIDKNPNKLYHIDEVNNCGNILFPIKVFRGWFPGRAHRSIGAGVILTGQSAPAAGDIPFIIMLNPKSNRYVREPFEELLSLRERGVSHLSQEIKQYRLLFRQSFTREIHKAVDLLKCDMPNDSILLRYIQVNWGILLATYQTLFARFNMPMMNNEDMFIICKIGVQEQYEFYNRIMTEI